MTIWDTWSRRLYAASTYILIGWVAAGYFKPVSVAPRPVAPPAPIPIAATKHTGHFTVSYIEPRYGSPASAAVRDDLAALDWHALDTTFRAYTEGQDELKTLGFVSHFASTGLPVCFVQETGPKGAPIIATVEGPASAAVVVSTVKGLRGQ
jgi:hypothetical protein